MTTKEREYVIMTVIPPRRAHGEAAGSAGCEVLPSGAHYLHDVPQDASNDRAAIEAHFRNACALLAREIEVLSTRPQALSEDERLELISSLSSLLETHALLCNDPTRSGSDTGE